MAMLPYGWEWVPCDHVLPSECGCREHPLFQILGRYEATDEGAGPPQPVGDSGNVGSGTLDSKASTRYDA